MRENLFWKSRFYTYFCTSKKKNKEKYEYQGELSTILSRYASEVAALKRKNTGFITGELLAFGASSPS